MPKPVNKNPSVAAGKKRKEVSESDNDESDPPKKRCRKKYYCKSEGCTNQAYTGGVCVRHGAKKRLCSIDGCTNIVKRRGVCCRHGGKRLCKIDGCTNQARNGGVCRRHGAKVEYKRCSSDGCKNKVINGGVCIRHGAKVKLCIIDECTNYVKRRGVCRRHGAYRDPHEKIILCRNVQGEGNQNNEFTVMPISDDEEEEEEEEEEKRRTRVPIAKTPARRSSRLSKLHNEDSALLGNVNQMEEDEVEVANSKHDESDATPPKPKGARGEGEVNLKGDQEEDASDVAPTEEGKGELSEAVDDGGNWGDVGQDGTNFGAEDNDDVNSAVEIQSHVVPDEITTTTPNDNEKEQRVVMLESKLKEAEIEVVQLNEQLSKRSEELEAVKSRSVYNNEQLQSRLKKVKAEIGVQSEVIAQLKKKLEEEKRSKLTWKALWAGQKQKFEEAESWAQAFWNLRSEMKKVFAMLKDTKYRLKTKSVDVLDLEKKVGELAEWNESLRSQLDKQRAEEVAVEEEELTDNEDVIERMKKRGTTEEVTILKAKVDFAASEAAKRELELDEARDKIEELSAENKELHRQVQFKVKWSSRSRPSTSTRDSLHSLEGTTYTL